MFRLTRTHRARISNRMAALAVFLLVAAAMAGLNTTSNDAMGAANSMADNSNETPAQAQSVRSAKASRGLKFNFYLFRHK